MSSWESGKRTPTGRQDARIREILEQLKVIAGLATAIAVFSSVDTAHWIKTDSLLVLASLVAREVLMGAALGLVASLVFLAVGMAGSLLGCRWGSPSPA